MEQIFLYLAILAALSGFAMGLVNLMGPFLKRRNITFPSLSIASLFGRSAEDLDDPLDQPLDASLGAVRDPAEGDLDASEKPLLARRQRLVQPDGDDEELDEELASVLDEVAEAEREAVHEAERASDEDSGDTAIYTVPAEVAEPSGAENEESESEDLQVQAEAEDGLLVEDQDDDEVEDDEDDEEEEENEDDQVEADADDEVEDENDEDEYEDEDQAASGMQVVAGGGGDGDDMLSFFDEASDTHSKSVAPWQEDLPEVSIEELLAEARAISQRIKGKKSDAA